MLTPLFQWKCDSYYSKSVLLRDVRGCVSVRVKRECVLGKSCCPDHGNSVSEMLSSIVILPRILDAFVAIRLTYSCY